ncbi:MAG: cell division ATP-binding protein FtsE [Armatimonadota bacterium]|jgi:cell division transport system ATP-binding protein|nr:cell division ATP-binding protein FtsE [Armatimonadota bacterium]MDT7972395.1 cell division ATP-binding protein FtsE [Armatimonadota bacterium]
MVVLRDVTVDYGNGAPALQRVNLTVEKSEFVFVVGPTGAGKSTLLKLLTREVIPTEGQVWVAGREVTQMKLSQVPHLRRLIGTVFQDILLLPDRTVWENVAFALRVTGASSATVLREVPKALEMVGMLPKAKAFPRELSGGEKQKVALARALVIRPLLLLADEPTGNLDPVASQEIVELLLRINRQGTTVLMATHDWTLVNAYRQRVVELQDGRIVRDELRGVFRRELA